jgi:hypothetical protein
MTITVKHKHVSPKSDGSDSTLIQPSDWNNNHSFAGTANTLFGFDSTGAGGEVTPDGTTLTLSGNSLSVANGGLSIAKLDAAAQATIAAKAPSASPAFTGIPTAPTQASGDNSTRIATTAFTFSYGVRSDVAQGLDSASKALARSNIGAASSGANSDITSLGGLTTALTLAQGGTGATTAVGARTALELGSAALLTAGTGANNVVQLDASAKLPAVDGSALTNIKLSIWDVICQEQRASGSNSGNSVASTWNITSLNTLVKNTIGATLSGSVLTVPAGTYDIEWFSVAGGSTGVNKSRLYDPTNSIVLAYGTGATVTAAAILVGSVTLTFVSATTIRLDQYTANGVSPGLGMASSQGTEIYRGVMMKKVG